MASTCVGARVAEAALLRSSLQPCSSSYTDSPAVGCLPRRSWSQRRCNLSTSIKGVSLRTGAQATKLRRACSGVEAVAAPPPSAPTFQSLPGFSQLGEPVPDGLSMSDILKTLPKEVFQINEWRSWASVAVTLAAVGVGYAGIAVAPWYMLPFVYIYMSAAYTGLFVLGHDAGHMSFSKYPIVNDIVGLLMFAPLIFPFEPWRIKHNHHHAHTNKLVEDTAWQPFQPFQYDRVKGVTKAIISGATVGPFFWLASVLHWLIWHFDINKFRESERPKVLVSWAVVGAFGLGVLAPLLVIGGPAAFVKWWLLPWLGFHFWMSTFTLVHHTAPHIPFTHPRDWDQAKAQLGGTVHCEYPGWVEFLCHDISVHIPHHLSTKIPHYNLRLAHDALQQNFDKHLNKAEFGIPLLKTIVDNCSLYDSRKKRYVPFDKKLR